MKTGHLVGYVISAGLFILGLIFALASSVQSTETRLAVALICIASSLMIVYFIQRSRSTEIIQRVELSGPMAAQPLTCPNCSASLSLDQARVVNGVTVVKCTYCGHTFEVTEKPKW